MDSRYRHAQGEGAFSLNFLLFRTFQRSIWQETFTLPSLQRYMVVAGQMSPPRDAITLTSWAPLVSWWDDVTGLNQVCSASLQEFVIKLRFTVHLCLYQNIKRHNNAAKVKHLQGVYEAMRVNKHYHTSKNFWKLLEKIPCFLLIHPESQ